MRPLIVILAVVCLGPALCTDEAAAADKPAKNAVVFEGDVGPTVGGVTELATVTLRRFRPKQILRIDVTLEVYAILGGELALLDGVQVNGHSVPFESTFCNGRCRVAGSAFVDLDALAATNPEDFKKQPLVISIRGRLEGDPPLIDRRLRVLAQLIRK